MKTNSRAWHLYQARFCAGLALLLVLALGVFGNVFRFDNDFNRKNDPAVFPPAMCELADFWAVR
jgi:hypothetical protein